MNLQAAVRYFARLPFEGYDKALDTWDPDVTFGDFMAFDRFITARNFGQVKRNIVVAAEHQIDPKYRLLRSPNQEYWIVEAENADMDPQWSDLPSTAPVYSYIYQLHVAPHRVEVIESVTAVSASGYAGSKTETVRDTVNAGIERFGLNTSDDYDRVVYTENMFTFPGDTLVSPDNELRWNGRDYMITEVFETLLSTQVIANRRGRT